MSRHDYMKGFQMGVDKTNDAIILDTILETVMSNDHRPGKQAAPNVMVSEKLPKEKILFLNQKVVPILLQESTLLEVEPPILICGDTHGQFADLLDIMDNLGWPPKQRYLFMGDYVDRGDQSIELICLLLVLKIQNPDNFFLLRGNHETAEINNSYGFKDDCLSMYDIATWDAFQETFKCLPLVGLVGSRIICMHGGLSPNMQYLDDIRRIPRPVDIPETGLACDLLWADPTPRDKLPPLAKCCGYPLNRSRSTSVWFCPEAVNEFLKRNELDLVVRGHELVDDGYEFTIDKKVLTIFTAPYYCDHPNDAAVLSVDEQLRCQIKVFIFKKPLQCLGTSPVSGVPPPPAIPVPELWNEITLREKTPATPATPPATK